MRSPKIATPVGLCLLLAAPALALVATPAGADSREIFGFLSTGLVGGAAFASDGFLYHLGGWEPRAPVARVERFDGTGARFPLPSLPLPIGDGALTFDGRYAYLAGGRSAPDVREDRVVRFDPVTGASAHVALRLAQPTHGASAVWANGAMFVFGGDTASGCVDTIQRLDFASGTRSTMSARLPVANCWGTAVWTGEKAYLLGGTATTRRRVVEYDPATDAVRDLGDLLPFRAYYASAVWTGDVALLLGIELGGPTDRLLKFDPATSGVTEMRARLPTQRSLGSAAWDGERAFFFGGFGPTGLPEKTFFDQIVAFDFLPAAPTFLAATPGPEPGSVALSWTLPDPATYTKLQRVVVQRSTIEDASPAQSVTFAIPLGESFVDHDLIPGIRYYYRIAGETREGRGAWSEEADSRAAILPASPSILGQRPLADADGDGVVDAVEGNVCDGNVIEDIINAFGDENPYAGRCGNGDYDATAYADDDRDGIPDRAERVLCVALENGDLQRGVCNAAESDYGAPPLAWSSLVAPPPLP